MERKRKLTKEEIEDILKNIIIPFDSIKDVTSTIENGIQKSLKYELEEVEIYPSKIEKLKQHIINSFISSVISPNFPIGPITGDAVGQQQTQKTLNTFHQTGSAKSGGADGVKEAISLSKIRKLEYATIHFKNESLTYEDVMKLSKQFLGISVSFLADSQKPYSINFLKIEKNWWYQHSNISDIYENENSKRSCIRLTFNIQKLYDYRITTSEIGSLIERGVFSFKSLIEKEKTIIEVKCICSPTIQGIVDVFIKRTDSSLDHYLISLLHFDEFSNIYISGIPNITNFYAVKKPVMGLIRDGENIGNELHLYVSHNRFEGIPFHRLRQCIEDANYEIDPSLYKYINYIALFEYNPTIPYEDREIIILSADKYVNVEPHAYYSVTKLNDLWKVTINLYYINSGYVFYSLENLLRDEFGNYKIKDVKRVDLPSHIIIKTVDSYETFMKRISSPLSYRFIDTYNEGSFLNINLSIPLTQNAANKLYILLQECGYSEVEITETQIKIKTSDTYDKFKSKFQKQEDKKYKYYVFAETSGSDLTKICMNPNVEKRKTWCNNYHQIFNCFGIEALHNFLVYDLKNMINDSGYINGKYVELLADVLTHTGMNPMTSEGILGHGRGSLAYATFDRVINHLLKAIVTGKHESTASTSISIILGKQMKLGTGGFKVDFDKSQLIMQNHEDTDLEFAENYEVGVSDMFNNSFGSNNGVIGNSDDDNLDVVLEIPEIIPGKLPMLKWIYDNILIKNVDFYVKQGIEILYSNPHPEVSMYKISDMENLNSIVKKNL